MKVYFLFEVFITLPVVSLSSAHRLIKTPQIQFSQSAGESTINKTSVVVSLWVLKTFLSLYCFREWSTSFKQTNLSDMLWWMLSPLILMLLTLLRQKRLLVDCLSLSCGFVIIRKTLFLQKYGISKFNFCKFSWTFLWRKQDCHTVCYLPFLIHHTFINLTNILKLISYSLTQCDTINLHNWCCCTI